MPRGVIMAKKISLVQKMLRDMENAWKEMRTTPVRMTIEEFEKRILRLAKRHGTPYSTEPGKWLDRAKEALADPTVPQEQKNLCLAKANPRELRPALHRFSKSFLTLCRMAEWSYQDLKAFCDNPTKDKRLRTFLRWRALPPAEALHKLYKLNTSGLMTERHYFSIRPTVILCEVK